MKDLNGKIGTTKQGFGGILKAGIRGVVIKQDGENITVRLYHERTWVIDIYHGKLADFTFYD